MSFGRPEALLLAMQGNGITANQHEFDTFTLKTFNHVTIILIKQVILHFQALKYK